jgi:hypothetical protein
MTDDEDKKEREIMQAIVQVIVQTPEFAEFYHGCEEQERRPPKYRASTIATTAPETRRDEQSPRSAHSMMS